MIIGILGSIGSGKNTVAKHLVSNHGYRQDSFASVLKDLLSALFGWDRSMLEGITDESRVWRETVDQWWSVKLGIPNFTPRYAMQHIGTDVLRKHFSDNLWVLTLEKRILDSQCKNIVISDVRFKNEYHMLRSHGARFLHIEKNVPEWFSVAAQFNAKEVHTEEDYLLLAKFGLDKLHKSEWDWVGLQCDEKIYNTQDLAYLYKKVDEFILKEKG